jgi:hypothetical protein
MKTRTALTLAYLLTVCLIAPARSSETLSAAHVDEIVGAYELAWQQPDAEKRDALLADAWSKKGVFRDPGGAVSGRAALSKHIGKFHEEFPNTRAERTSKIDFHGRSFRFTWKMVFAKDGRVLEGTDFGEIGADGKIASITGFWQPLFNLTTTANQAIVIAYLDAVQDAQPFGHQSSWRRARSPRRRPSYGGVFVGFRNGPHVHQVDKLLRRHRRRSRASPPMTPATASSPALMRFRPRPAGEPAADPGRSFSDGRSALTPSYYDTKSLVDTLITRDQGQRARASWKRPRRTYGRWPAPCCPECGRGAGEVARAKRCAADGAVRGTPARP